MTATTTATQPKAKKEKLASPKKAQYQAVVAFRKLQAAQVAALKLVFQVQGTAPNLEQAARENFKQATEAVNRHLATVASL